MILSDITLCEALESRNLIIAPLQEEQIQPASIDLRLSESLIVDDELVKLNDDGYCLKPNEFILGSTYEYVELPSNLVARVDGRSSIGRLGVMVHVTAGYIDPGYCGNITLEIYNVSNKEFILKPCDSICQLVVETLTHPSIRPYGSEGLNSKYQHSEGTVKSRYGVE